MSRVVVLGGGIIGLATGMLLARQGHGVTVLERDPQPRPDSPEQAWESWDRHGVAQFRQAHFLQPGARRVLEAQLPEVAASLRDVGACAFNALDAMPPTITDRAPRPGDDRLTTLTARRPVAEYVVGRHAEEAVDVRRGVEVVGLATRPGPEPGVPHVTGVRLGSGETQPADLVIDAMGRRSRLPDWLAAVGARAPIEQIEDSGFTYYTRFFHTTGTPPVPRAPLLTALGSFSLLTLPADAQTWSVTIYISSHDQAMKGLRDPERWTQVVGACPRHAHWLDGEPLTGVLPIAGVVDRFRRMVVDGAAVATGVVAVGDAWACTNPSGGRGIALGLLHAVATSDVVADHFEDPGALALAHDEVTQARLTPWYAHTIGIDRARAAAIQAEIDGTPPALSADPAAVVGRAFPVAAMQDADLFRAFLEVGGVLTLPQDVLARPGLRERVLELAAGQSPQPVPAPSRSELLAMMA
jgi:2-polyprenyl-6-methoxyphenol hydroxylase-like FAD-dependent oxidoreductase